MKKRSAMLMAAGLVIALAVAGAAFSLGATGPASAGTPATAQRDQPRVRTVTKVVTVHRNGDPVIVSGGGSTASGPSATRSSDDPSQDAQSDDHEDTFQDDHGEDDGEESGDHGEDDHEGDGEFEVDD